MSNSKLLVFNSEQALVTLYGNATNWNGSGYDQVFETASKFRVKRLTDCVMISIEQCNDKSSHLILYKRQILRNNEIFWDFVSP